jgi:hypothetical protein
MQHENYHKFEADIIGPYPTQADKSVRTSIQSPKLLHIHKGRSISYGAHQVWYPNWIQRMAGCGPTAASNLLWYLTATRPQLCGGLFKGNGTTYDGMLSLMEEVWNYVKPGLRGVDKSSMFTDGAVGFGMDHGISLKTRVLEIPSSEKIRPDMKTVLEFLTAAFSDDLPVAFLNLSNGAVRNLDNWHWVTLVSVDEALQAEMYDQGLRQNINLQLWLATTAGGGALVTLEP